MKKYIINKKELKKILNGYLQFIALENGGVDNWEWCGTSCSDFLKENNVDDFDELVDKKIINYEEYKGE